MCCSSDLFPFKETFGRIDYFHINKIEFIFRFYATGNFQTTTGDLFGRHQTTVSRIVLRVTRAICIGAADMIQMPIDVQGLLRLKRGFAQMGNPAIPDVVGLIDCTHVKIISPGGAQAELFRNRKGYFSINVQAIGSFDLRVLDIEARWPGSAHDSNIFDNSLIKVRESYPNH